MGGQRGTVQGTDVLAGFGPPQWIPEPYQARGVDGLCNTEAALFFKPGLGKTSTALMAFTRLQTMDLAMRMLVVAPLKVCIDVWPKEVKKWQQFAHLRIGVANGPKKAEVLDDLSLDIVCINYEGLLWLGKYLETHPNNFDVVCYDELTKMKNHSSKRFKTWRKHMGQFQFRWGLTGTPMANGVLDLFAQVYCLDLGKRLGKYVTHFRMRYAHQVPWDPHRWYVHEDKATQILDKITDIVTYVGKDVLDLPPLKKVIRPVSFSSLPSQDRKRLKSQYAFLEDEFILRLEDTVITAANAGVLTSKLRQFTGGAIYDAQREWEPLHTLKIDAVEELLGELNGETLIVVYQFDHERQRLLERFPEAKALKGGMSASATREVLDAWDSGAVQVLLAQPASASMGLNLQRSGHNICWFTPTYNQEEFEQMSDRLHRKGQENKVMCYMLTMEGTIDEEVNKILVNKDATQAELLELLNGIRLQKSAI